jgi:glycosyltransferase involved in cell wall biosynthesis
MAPLHNLADFCLAVRADVVAAVGAADEAYGRGPCWEMDYGVRAARAGFRSVWAQAAFVRRGAMPTWRAKAESGLLEVSKRLYQDRFCGLRLAPGGPDAPYHDACRGEACLSFAPAGAVAVRLPLAKLGLPATDLPPPLISCVMPTRGRPRFVAQSVAYFRRQTYPNRELVIVYEDDADLPAGIEGDDIRLVRTTQRVIGAKRNVAAGAARGEIIAHWDDDDWYGRERLARQAAPILQGVADITGLNDMLFMALGSGAFWSATPELFARLFVENVSGGTLMFRRGVWERSGPYPAISLREDAEFMIRAMRDGARLRREPGRDLCVYVRHDANTWKFSEGAYLQPDQWLPAVAPDFIQPDLGFYWPAGLAKPVGRPAPRRAERPLVSCLMPTANRRAFVPQAIRSFLAQDYPARELIVIDDGRESVEDLIPPAESIRYIRLDQRQTVGAKRNAAAELARGEVLAHWDDDDWMAPQWLGSQVRTLLDEGADLCGLDKVYFYAPETRQGWRYVYDGAQPWVCGGTLCYTKDLWRRSPFQGIDIGEDNQFVWSAVPKRLAINRRHDLYVATVHRGNTSPKLTSSRRWRSVPAARLEQLMRDLPAREDAV